MRFASRSHPGRAVSLRAALFSGLAPDGGLYHPVEKSDLAALFASFDESVTFQELAAATAAALFSPELDAAASARIAARAFSFAPALRRLDENLLLLELFHGPTCAFKDFGAQFLAACMEEFLGGEKCQILVATSGDTGSAVAHAFHGRDNVDVVILYPAGRVSELQEKQLTTLGGNVHALEIEGSFDDCQRLAREAFQDPGLRAALRLTSANSINIGRLLPQTFYYIFAASQRASLRNRAPLFCVPSGNFGNLAAGLYAWSWGLPVRGFLAATNVNDVVPVYLSTGAFEPRPSMQTLSNAMDVGNPSNFERMERLFARDQQARGKMENGEAEIEARTLQAMRKMVSGAAVSDARTLQTMREIHDRYGVFVDPHTAVGCAAAFDYLARSASVGSAAPAWRDQTGASATPASRSHPAMHGAVIVLATAHPAKFVETVVQATGNEPEMPGRLAACLSRPKQAQAMGTTLTELSRFLLERFA